MMTDGRTLVAVVDGRRARLFQEARYGGPLSEHPEWVDGLKPGHANHKGPAGSIHDSHGSATHGTAHEGGHDKSEHDYLLAVVRRIETVITDQAFDHLVLMAPPRALGILRNALSVGLMRRLTCSEPHDRLDEPIATIEVRLRELRRDKA